MARGWPADSGPPRVHQPSGCCRCNLLLAPSALTDYGETAGHECCVDLSMGTQPESVGSANKARQLVGAVGAFALGSSRERLEKGMPRTRTRKDLGKLKELPDLVLAVATTEDGGRAMCQLNCVLRTRHLRELLLKEMLGLHVALGCSDACHLGSDCRYIQLSCLPSCFWWYNRPHIGRSHFREQ